MKRDLVLLTVLAAAAFAVLVGLGFWQLQRLAWKEDLIAQIASRTQAAPVSLDDAVERWKRTGDIEYLRVRLTGSLLHQQEKHLFTVIKGESGWRIVTPLQTPDGHVIMIDRGFVPIALKAPEARMIGQVNGIQSYVGLARRPGKKGLFTPDNDVKANAWYWRDLQSMAASATASNPGKDIVPFFVELEENPVPGGWPRGGVTRVQLSNKHLQYAGTWFGLAGALLVVYGVFVFGRMRRRSFT